MSLLNIENTITLHDSGYKELLGGSNPTNLGPNVNNILLVIVSLAVMLLERVSVVNTMKQMSECLLQVKCLIKQLWEMSVK